MTYGSGDQPGTTVNSNPVVGSFVNTLRPGAWSAQADGTTNVDASETGRSVGRGLTGRTSLQDTVNAVAPVTMPNVCDVHSLYTRTQGISNNLDVPCVILPVSLSLALSLAFQ